MKGGSINRDESYEVPSGAAPNTEIERLRFDLERYKSVLEKQTFENLKLKFDNDILLSRVQKSTELDETAIPSSDDVDLNYNTKANYVNSLQKRIWELTEMLMQRDGNFDALEEKQILEMKILDLESDVKSFNAEIKKLKEEKQAWKKSKKDFETILPEAKKMRSLLKLYYLNGELPRDLLNPLKLHEQNPLLDDIENDHQLKKKGMKSSLANDRSKKVDKVSKISSPITDSVNPDNTKESILKGSLTQSAALFQSIAHKTVQDALKNKVTYKGKEMVILDIPLAQKVEAELTKGAEAQAELEYLKGQIDNILKERDALLEKVNKFTQAAGAAQGMNTLISPTMPPPKDGKFVDPKPNAAKKKGGAYADDESILVGEESNDPEVLKLQNSKLQEELVVKTANADALTRELTKMRKEMANLHEVLKEKKMKYRNKLKFTIDNAKESELDLTSRLFDTEIRRREEDIQNFKIKEIEKDRQLALRDEQIRRLEGRLDNYAKDTKQALEEVYELRRYKTILDELRSGQADYVDLKVKMEILNEQLSELRNVNAIMNKENESLKEKFQSHYDDMEKRYKDIEALRAENGELSMKAFSQQGLTAAAEERVKEAEERIVGLKDEIARLNKKIEDKDQEVLEIKEISAKQALLGPKEAIQLRFLEKERDGLSEKFEELEKELVKQQDAIREKESLIKKLTEQLNNADPSDSGRAESLLAERDTQILELITDCNRKSEEIDALRNALNSAPRIRGEEQRHQISNGEANSSSNGMNLAMQMGAFQGLGDSPELKQFAIKIAELSTSKGLLEKAANEAKTALNRAQEKLTLAEAQTRKLDNDNQELKRKLHNEEVSSRFLKENIEKLNSELGLKNTAIKTLQLELDEAREQIIDNSKDYLDRFHQERAQREAAESRALEAKASEEKIRRALEEATAARNTVRDDLRRANERLEQKSELISQLRLASRLSPEQLILIERNADFTAKLSLKDQEIAELKAEILKAKDREENQPEASQLFGEESAEFDSLRPQRINFSSNAPRVDTSIDHELCIQRQNHLRSEIDRLEREKAQLKAGLATQGGSNVTSTPGSLVDDSKRLKNLERNLSEARIELQEVLAERSKLKEKLKDAEKRAEKHREDFERVTLEAERKLSDELVQKLSGKLEGGGALMELLNEKDSNYKKMVEINNAELARLQKNLYAAAEDEKRLQLKEEEIRRLKKDLKEAKELLIAEEQKAFSAQESLKLSEDALRVQKKNEAAHSAEIAEELARLRIESAKHRECPFTLQAEKERVLAIEAKLREKEEEVDSLHQNILAKDEYLRQSQSSQSQTLAQTIERMRESEAAREAHKNCGLEISQLHIRLSQIEERRALAIVEAQTATRRLEAEVEARRDIADRLRGAEEALGRAGMTLDSQSKAMDQLIRHSAAKIETLYSAIKASQPLPSNEISALNADLLRFQRFCQQLAGKSDDSLTSNRRLQLAEQKLIEASAELKAKQNELDLLKKKLAHFDKLVAPKLASINSLQPALEQALYDTNNGLRSSVEQGKSIQEASDQLASLAKEVQQLSAKLADSERKRNSTTSADIQQLEARLGVSEQNLSLERSKNKELQEKVAELEQESKELAEQLSKMKSSQAAEFSEQDRALLKDKDKQLEDARAKLEELKQKLAIVNATNLQLQKNQDEDEQTIRQLNEEIDKAINQLNTKVSTYEKTIESLKAQLAK